MSEFISDDIKEYERLKIEQKRIEERIEELGSAIKIFMLQEGADITPTLPMGGKIHLKNKTKWLYTTDVGVAEDKVKELKKHEQLNGKANGEVYHFIEYRK